MQSLRTLTLLTILLLAAGCVSHPAYVKCKGKGVITGQGHISGGYGGANMFGLTVDCGEGLEYYRGPAPPAK